MIAGMTDGPRLCPKCGNAVDAEAAYCGVCYEVLRKTAPAGAPEAGRDSLPPQAPPLVSLSAGPAAAAFLFAFVFARRFADYLPITDAWMRVARGYPFGLANLVFHEGGHAVFGVLGWQFLTVLGGSAMQLLIPAACLVHLYLRRSRVGVLLCVAWLGQNLIDLAFYIADAKQQALILITGTSGTEGSFHDWAYLLDVFGMRRHAVGLGQAAFFAGCFALSWPAFYAAGLAGRRLLGRR